MMRPSRRLEALLIQTVRGARNREKMLEFENFLAGLGYSEACRAGYLMTLTHLEKFLGGKSFRDASESELLSFLKQFKNPVTRATYATRIKAFYRWLITGKWGRGPYPKIVENIVTSVRKKELPAKSVEEILTQDEVLRIIDAAQTSRDKALIAMLYDTGARPGEIISLRLKDVRLNEVAGEVIVYGKTGRRRIPLTFSVPYIKKWLNEHPLKDNPNAQLFLKLKTGRGGEEFSTSGLYGLIEKLGKKAGLKKKISPYTFRHSRLTELANVLREHQLKALAGWTAGSKMAEHYVRLAGLDLDAPLLEYYGLKKPEEHEESKLKPKACRRCNNVNPPTAIYCEKCLTPLDDKSVIKRELEREEQMRAEVEELRKIVSEHAYLLVSSIIASAPDAYEKITANPLLRGILEKSLGPRATKILSSRQAFEELKKEILGVYEDLDPY